MTSLNPEYVIFTVPSGRDVSSKLKRIDADEINTTLLNGQPISGGLVSADGVITLTNKSLEDATTFIIGDVDPTTRITFDADGSAGTTSTVRFTQSSNSTYIVPDVGPSSSFILSEGTQSINGTKTFADITATNINLSQITSGRIDINDNQSLLTDGTLSTTDNTPTVQYTFPTTTDYAYLITAKVVCAGSTKATATFKKSIKAKNIAGVVTLGVEFESWDDIDVALNGVYIQFGIVSTDIVLSVVGILDNIRWTGVLEVIQIDF